MLSALGAQQWLSLGSAAFIAYTAWWLYRSQPENTLKRLIAVYLVAVVAQSLGGVGRLLEGDANITRWNNVGHAVWTGSFFWIALATVAIFYVYPRRPERGSLDFWFFAGLAGILVVATVLWFLEPDVYYLDQGSGTSVLWWLFVRVPGRTLLVLLALTAAVWRAREMDEADRRAALILLPSIVPWLFVVGGIRLSQAAYQVAGARDVFLQVIQYFDARPGNIGHLLPSLWFTQHALVLALTAYLVWRHRSYLALGMVVSGVLITTVPPLAFISLYAFFFLWTPIGILYAIGRHRALGGDDRDRTAWNWTAGTVAAFVFVLIFAAGLARRPDQATVPIALVVSGLCSLAAGVGVHPSGWSLRESSAPVQQGPFEARAANSENGRMGDRFQVLEHLGSGGSGSVHEVHDTVLDRRVAVKVLEDASSDEAWERLQTEARRVADVRHPRLVDVLDLLRIDGDPHLVMEYAAGGSLADRIDDGSLGDDDFHQVARQALDALEVIHSGDLLHRDLKPSNVLLTGSGDAKLADFGIARCKEDQTALEWHGPGSPKGTVAYMSPEQAKGQPVDERSDLYSLAATLYEAYTGEAYVQVDPAESLVEVQMRVAGLVPFDEEIEASQSLQEWFATALAPRPEDRFPSAREMRQALDEILEESETPGSQAEPSEEDPGAG